MQRGMDDCGLFAIAFALHSALGHCIEEIDFDQATMRNHLVKCFTARKFTPFTTKKVKRACSTRIMSSAPVRCLPPMGTWCSVVCVSSGSTSNVLAFSHFHRQQRNGIVCYAAHKYWCANELYYLFYYSVVAQMNLKYL